MRILKRKIKQSFKALTPQEYQELLNADNLNEEQDERVPKVAKKIIKKGSKKNHRRPFESKKKKWSDSKNIIKNYGKAMCSFATSEIALPYLQPIAKQENVNIQKFIPWVQGKKENLDTIEGIRNSLLVYETDDRDIAAYKRIFQKISEIFLKYFSVNWIYSGKLRHRMIHLYFRFKMLRRVRHPESFTYLKDSRRRKY
jgi:hypothetical protein